MKRWLLILLMTLSLGPLAHADQTTLMARSRQPFEQVLEQVKEVLGEYGYTVAHIQKCDGGLAQFGYHTDKYQLVFFGKLEEVRQVSHRHPEMIPFLPLKLAVFAERDETVMVALNPLELGRYINDPHLQTQLARWHSDIRAMLEELRSGG
jgi:uncharacterized protein (DUF302 family)